MTNKTKETIECNWKDCELAFESVHSLVNHLDTKHVGIKKPEYRCYWENCPRYNIVQNSRFSLITHLRSHTGERPHPCKVAGCDKSFTRSESLAKHLKTVHNIDTPVSRSRGTPSDPGTPIKSSYIPKKEIKKKKAKKFDLDTFNEGKKNKSIEMKRKYLKNLLYDYNLKLTDNNNKIDRLNLEKTILLSTLEN